MKRWLAAVALAVMCVGLFSACGSPIGTATGTPPGGAPPGVPSGGPSGAPPGGQAPSGGGTQTETSGTAATTFSTATTESSQTYASTKADENAVRVEGGATVALSDPTVNKSGDSSDTNNSDFYGMNAGILVRDSGQLTLTGGNVTTAAAGGNGIFVYNTGSTATVSGTTIRTSSNNSGGIEVAGGGTLTAANLDIVTQGGSSAAIRSDRGGGTLTVDQGTYATNGVGSPAVYSTANVTVSNATLTANQSEAVVIEGANSVTLDHSTVVGDMTTSNGGSGENLHSVMIYQSMSGDATNGGGSFTMSGGSLTGRSGDLFYVTNTTATIALSGVKLANGSGNLLTVAGNDGSRGWGTAGSNGGTCHFSATGQTLSGVISVDSISSLDLSLTSGSNFTGTINPAGAAGTVAVTLSGDSTWTLTADAYLTSFTGATSGVTANGHHVYVDGTPIV